MNYIHRHILSHPRYVRMFEWGKALSITGAAQILVQASGLLCGILIIRLLPVKEYAFYTIANTMLGTMTVLADGGISSGVMAQGGKVWKDKDELGKVLATGLDLRRKFAIGSLLITIPILTFLLWRQGADIWMIVLIVLTLIPAFFAALSDSILGIVSKLHQDIKPLQYNQVKVGVFRLILSACFVWVFPFTFIALLASGIPRIYGNLQMKKIASKFSESNSKPTLEYRQNILRIVKKMMPGAIYYCISGQITIWLISFLGSTDSIAKVGALGRFSMLLSVFTVLFGTLVTPRFARMQEDKISLLKKFATIQILLIFLCTLFCGLIYLFPQPALWLLGNKFSGLHVELTLSVVSSSLSLMSGVFFGLSSSRGWPTHPAILITGNVLSVAAGILLFDLTSLRGALWFNIFISTYPVIIHSLNFYYKIFRK
ncbi:MATE family efflux transporter [Pedobacter metabolipauper]|uniref:O-antigen/teichoic acid export membrane protein n=1 Tax=Pedobacter metabolipauper TaxID=425513 RepID=A0A4R6SZ57_9SPHI|nr:polysaccharide biosynthesis protein [Pedobacter metabolipauper]TDQ09984.1 O-antigen/teichoic acid export membrane protein [Pedobacter metabolipauper]